jgi:hypothetical protein
LSLKVSFFPSLVSFLWIFFLVFFLVSMDFKKQIDKVLSYLWSFLHNNHFSISLCLWPFLQNVIVLRLQESFCFLKLYKCCKLWRSSYGHLFFFIYFFNMDVNCRGHEHNVYILIINRFLELSFFILLLFFSCFVLFMFPHVVFVIFELFTYVRHHQHHCFVIFIAFN